MYDDIRCALSKKTCVICPRMAVQSMQSYKKGSTACVQSTNDGSAKGKKGVPPSSLAEPLFPACHARTLNGRRSDTGWTRFCHSDWNGFATKSATFSRCRFWGPSVFPVPNAELRTVPWREPLGGALGPMRWPWSAISSWDTNPQLH